MGHDVAGKPTLGAVVSYGSGIGTDYGHVMIVEQVDSPDKFRVSEMNYDNKGGLRDSTVWTHNANGTWSSSTGATKSLKFTP